MLHLDDPERLGFLARILDEPHPPIIEAASGRERRLLSLLHFSLWGPSAPLDKMNERFERLWSNKARRIELLQLVDVLRNRMRRVVQPVDPSGRIPLHVHAQYSRDEALAAFGLENPGSVRQGVRWAENEHADVFFVTLRKTERHYSPTTMYQDRAITPSLFQWESQSTTSEASPTGQRYIHHRVRGSTVHLFIRETKEADGDMGAPPYLYAGPATYVSHSSDRPMKILWKLDFELPADVFHAARVVAA
jgi:hypothetical protein